MLTTITYRKVGRRHLFTCDGPAIACTKDMTFWNLSIHLRSFHGLSNVSQVLENAKHNGKTNFEDPIRALYE